MLVFFLVFFLPMTMNEHMYDVHRLALGSSRAVDKGLEVILSTWFLLRLAVSYGW